MSRWFLVLCVLGLSGFTMIYDKHKDLNAVDEELNNVEDNKQDMQFRLLNATPTLTDLQDHEVVIMSTNGAARIMFRESQEIYSINMSCVTVIR